MILSTHSPTLNQVQEALSNEFNIKNVLPDNLERLRVIIQNSMFSSTISSITHVTLW